MQSRFLPVLLLPLLSGCESLPTWMGGDEPVEVRLEGERIEVLNYQRSIEPDDALKDADVTFLKPERNPDWHYDIAAQIQGVENLALGGMNETDNVSIGEGYGWKTALISQPVIGDGVLFAMDSSGFISAHKADQPSQQFWLSDVASLEDEPEINGGGLAYANGVVYVTTGYGSLLALVAADGSLLWRQDIDIPIRSAPVVEDGRVFAVTIDNQLIAHDARTGRPIWTHRGIKENAVYLGSVSPAVENGIVIAPYSSGELYALRAEDGSALWSDTLIVPQRTTATEGLTGIDATPLIKDGVVYGLSNNGMMVANLLSNGRGLWDLEISGHHTPWIAGEYIFVLTSEPALVAIRRKDGAIKWISSLRQMDDGRDITPRLSGPLVINNQVVVLTEAGEMLMFNPKDGQVAQRIDIPDDIRISPILANGKLYLLSADAVLTVYQ